MMVITHLLIVSGLHEVNKTLIGGVLMLVDGHCHSCGFDFDGHWSKTGTCIASAMTCPKCLVKGRCSTQTDEHDDYVRREAQEEHDLYEMYSDSGDDDADTIDE
jgi:hypothetical protein